uniref:Transcription elongation factor SPT6 homolog n=1 Tax=Tanacetum cinerariifolium TaxID=118510 RepID=A0A6L2JML8_TANCI|nr:transcription elongation factor SPT6 homolog [Tanacetum cinerariifolium]
MLALSVETHYSEKFKVPFIVMYRKEEYQSLFKDQEHGDMENLYAFDQKPTLMWQKGPSVLCMMKYCSSMKIARGDWPFYRVFRDAKNWIFGSTQACL